MRAITDYLNQLTYEYIKYQDLLEFTVCQRRDGTRYGIAEGKQCRIGREISREFIIRELERRGVIKTRSQKERFLSFDDEKLARISQIAVTRDNIKKSLKGLNVKQREAVLFAVRDLVARDKVKTAKDISRIYANSVTGRAKTGQTLYPPEVAKRYVEYLETGIKRVTRREFSDDEVNKIWDSLDSNTKRSLRIKGVPPDNIERDDNRGKLMLKLLISTGFRDEITGQPYSWRLLQPDHIRSVALTLASGEKLTESLNSLMITHGGYNIAKGQREGLVGKRTDLKSNEVEELINNSLLQEFRRQASISQSEFFNIRRQKDLDEIAKQEYKAQIKENSKLWDSRLWLQNVVNAQSSDITPLMQASHEIKGTSKNLMRFIVEEGPRGILTTRSSPTNVNKFALLLKMGVPLRSWPRGLYQSYYDSLLKTYKGLPSEQSRNLFIARFIKFVGKDQLPKKVKQDLKKILSIQE